VKSTPDFAHLGLGCLDDTAPFPENVAPGEVAWRHRHEPHDRKRRHRLAASRLADDADDAVRRERKADAIDSLGDTVVGTVPGFEILEFENMLHNSIAPGQSAADALDFYEIEFTTDDNVNAGHASLPSPNLHKFHKVRGGKVRGRDWGRTQHPSLRAARIGHHTAHGQ
jgi:hypothetical protein